MVLPWRHFICWYNATSLPNKNLTQTRLGETVKTYFSSGCFILFLSLLSLAAQSTHAQQQPRTPESDDEVLLVLPKSFLENRGKLSDLRDQLNENPDDPEKAAKVASEYLTLGKRSGDPRFYGYARAAINRWWDTDAPPEILKIRAKLKENDHLFDEALEDLKIAYSKNSKDAQVLLEIGNIYRVKGRYDDAMKVGDQLQTIIGDIPAILCRAPTMAQTGQAEEAYELLSKILPQAEARVPFLVPFILTNRAEIADVLGRDDEVEKHFTEGIAKDPGSFYLLRGYGDYLLDHDQADKALALLRDHTADTGVFLRAAIAAKRAGQAELAEKWTTEIETRFKEIELRGGQPHGRYQARLLLELRDDPDAALKVALKNWKQKKEVRDTRNALEAAIAAGKPAAAGPIIEFLRKNNNEHVLLKSLTQELESLK